MYDICLFYFNIKIIKNKILISKFAYKIIKKMCKINKFNKKEKVSISGNDSYFGKQ